MKSSSMMPPAMGPMAAPAEKAPIQTPTATERCRGSWNMWKMSESVDGASVAPASARACAYSGSSGCRERASAGGWINFAVFDARASSGTSTDNSKLLAQLTVRARAASLRVDQAALAFMNAGRLQFFGSPPLVEYLSRNGLPRWTHHIEV